MLAPKRCSLTYSENYWEDYLPLSEVQWKKIRALNKTIANLHGGRAEADAITFQERRSDEEMHQFMYTYGLDPERIKKFGIVHFPLH